MINRNTACVINKNCFFCRKIKMKYSKYNKIRFFMSLISTNNYWFSERLSQKVKTLLFLAVFTVSSFNVFTQNSSLISACSDFVAGPNATWPHVLIATTVADSAASQAAQTYTMNVTSLPAGGADVRVYKTVANGSAFYGNPVVLTLGLNTITVAAVAFNRAVKFQFSSGDVEFESLSLNGVDSECVANTTSDEMPEHYVFLNTFPNPSKGDLFIESNELIESIEIKDLTGRVVLKLTPQKNKVHIQTSQLKNSFYFLSCFIKQELISRKIILN